MGILIHHLKRIQVKKILPEKFLPFSKDLSIKTSNASGFNLFSDPI